MVRPLAALLAVAVVLAGTCAAGAATSRGMSTTLVVAVRSVETGSHAYDKAPTGLSKGDRWLIRDRLINTKKQFGKPRGAVVGSDQAILVFTSPTSATFTGTTKLPGGTVRVHGVIHVSGPSTAGTVDGGTGRYAHARGTIVIGSGTNPLNTYHLTLPAKPPGGTTV